MLMMMCNILLWVMSEGSPGGGTKVTPAPGLGPDQDRLACGAPYAAPAAKSASDAVYYLRMVWTRPRDLLVSA